MHDLYSEIDDRRKLGLICLLSLLGVLHYKLHHIPLMSLMGGNRIPPKNYLKVETNYVSLEVTYLEIVDNAAAG